MLDRAEKEASRQLDLAKFLESQRVVTFALLSMLSSPSRSLLKLVKIMVLDEEDDESVVTSSSDDIDSKSRENDIEIVYNARHGLKLSD